MRGAFVDVVFEDVPAGKDDVVQVGERNKILDQRRLVVGALAQADGAHLGERADGLGQSASHSFNAGDHRGGHGAQSDNHHSQLALGGLGHRNRCGSCLLAALFCIAHFVFPNLPLIALQVTKSKKHRRNSVLPQGCDLPRLGSRFTGLAEAVNVRPHEPDDRGEQAQLDDEMKTVKRLRKSRVGVPRFTELHAGVSKRKAPGP